MLCTVSMLLSMRPKVFNDIKGVGRDLFGLSETDSVWLARANIVVDGALAVLFAVTALVMELA